MPRHAPGHVLAQSLSADCYASYGVQLSLCRISALQARSRMQHHEGMHLLIKGFSVRPALGRPYAAPHQGKHIFPLLSELYRYVEPTAHPPPKCMARQINYITVKDICSCRSGSNFKMMDEVVIHKNGRLKARCIASYSRKFLNA